MGTKAIDARCVGSKSTLGEDGYFKLEDTLEMFTGAEVEGLEEYLLKYGVNGKLKNDDSNYESDEERIKNMGIVSKNGTFWYASRNIYYDEIFDVYFRVRTYLGRAGICRVNQPSYKPTLQDFSSTEGFRPVFLLSSDIQISSGSGSSEDPYVIE